MSDLGPTSSHQVSRLDAALDSISSVWFHSDFDFDYSELQPLPDSSPSELTPALASYSGGKLVALYWAPNAVFSVFLFLFGFVSFDWLVVFLLPLLQQQVSLPVLRRWPWSRLQPPRTLIRLTVL